MSYSINSYNSSNGEICWSAPSNIALVKYWGKRGDQLPCNPSVSFTLDNARTKTSIKWSPAREEQPQLQFLFHGESEEVFAGKIKKYLCKMETYFPFLKDFDLEISSENTFPHSTGIASSASSMAALALCLGSMEQEVLGEGSKDTAFYKKASSMARLGSGSASRSIYSELALWGETAQMDNSSDEYALGLSGLDPIFSTYRDAILIVDAGSKSVSSSEGHRLMETHPYAQTRFQQARQNTSDLLKAMRVGDLKEFGEIVEREALELHGLMANSTPSYILMKPNTLGIIDEVRSFREATGHPVYFTLDAGPNVHLLYPAVIEKDVQTFIETRLIKYLDQEYWLADRVGKGPTIE